MTCIQTGLFNPTDLEALNQLRKDLGLSQRRQEDFNQELIEKLMVAEQQKQAQEQAQSEASTEEKPEESNPYL
jgi:hypothetical protein